MNSYPDIFIEFCTEICEAHFYFETKRHKSMITMKIITNSHYQKSYIFK